MGSRLSHTYRATPPVGTWECDLRTFPNRDQAGSPGTREACGGDGLEGTKPDELRAMRQGISPTLPPGVARATAKPESKLPVSRSL
ncbi:hypothetical protein CORC01_06996 [Colletotrichum orchidophilum]|uniref:Uncharacterized protein n=1 Tax=Colletotrichum orchidophilum TaxID=1209926 RepID=A0A1G4B8Q9_9PEZI|nr:uncharacterized protein CORC01_06996 [Colletotrichum orchidophilum]OHE97791.1 hypothetical protein CORC01_06996 [Colletotrichum orchidophilum]